MWNCKGQIQSKDVLTEGAELSYTHGNLANFEKLNPVETPGESFEMDTIQTNTGAGIVQAT